MGTIVTRGEARKEYETELMTITIAFKNSNLDENYVIKYVQRSCEYVLEELNKINLPPESIQLKDSGVVKSYNSEFLEGKKEIVIKTAADKKLCAYICSVIKNSIDKIEYSFSYELKNENEKREHLIKEAVEDSRRQAEIIAKALNKEIIGAESVNDVGYLDGPESRYLTLSDDIDLEIPEDFESDTPLSDRTAFPTISLEESVEIRWKMSE